MTPIGFPNVIIPLKEKHRKIYLKIRMNKFKITLCIVVQTIIMMSSHRMMYGNMN